MEIQTHKKKLIEEIKQINKDDIFPKEEKVKLSFIQKLSKMLGI